MQLVRLAVALTLSAALACAADSFLGKWDLNVQNSYIEAGSGFQACTKLRRGAAKFKRDQNGYSWEVEAECKDGETFGLRALAAFDSHAYPGILRGREVIGNARRLSERSFKILVAEKQTQKVMEEFLFNISSDDRTFVFTDLKLGEKTPSVTLVYDRR